MSTPQSILQELIETVDKMLESIDENYSVDLKLTKSIVIELREELEEVFESHGDDI
jgi:hypothetical protein